MIEGMAYAISGIIIPVKKTTTTTGTGGDKVTGNTTTDDGGDEIKIGTVTKTFGSLEIKCEMDGVLFIDDKQIGDVSAGTKVPIEKLKTGTRKIKIKGSSGEFVKEVQIEENKKSVITAQREGGKSTGTVKTDDSQKSKVTDNSNAGSTFTDPRDGKVYKTVKIGNQVWMAENLNYDAGSGSWCYDNRSSNCSKYGRLYDWETAKRVAPPGWHLPSKSEFETLLNNLGGEGANAYKRIIPLGSCGFNALFGGYRLSDGDFDDMGTYAYFWSSTEFYYHNNNASNLHMNSSGQQAGMRSYSKNYGFSVRCVQDNYSP